MSLKKRLTVTFIMLTCLPIIMTIIAFILLSGMVTFDIGGPVKIGMTSLESFSNVTELTEEVYHKLDEEILVEPEKFSDMDFLEDLNKKLSQISSFLLIRKGEDLFYSGDKQVTRDLFPKLPAYELEEMKTDAGYYFNKLNVVVRQLDFQFADKENGSLFIVTTANQVVSKHLVLKMFLIIVIILIFTSVALTRWINKGVFYPIRQLNVAMSRIAEGNFDYVLEKNENNGEIGELYNSYEDMRLKLKESTEEKILHEKQNRELISNITHDLKTPITSIKGYVEGIIDGVADTDEKMQKYIKTIYTKANQMDGLINELTYYSGIDSNKIPYHFQSINVSDYFNDCVEDVGLDLESKNIRLNYSNLISSDTRIIADPEQLKKVINNIIGNSIKYTDNEHAEIEIRLLDEVDSIRVEIEDNGKGIAQKDLSKIFERFYRTDTSRNSSQGGSGIGLSIVKKIIEDHGGYIWATSKEGEGTCMHFVIRKYIEKKDE